MPRRHRGTEKDGEIKTKNEQQTTNNKQQTRNEKRETTNEKHYICNDMSLITATGITKSYNELHVLRGIEMQIAKSEIVSVVGASGAGKTTLLTILGTLDRADGGKLIIDDQDISLLNAKKISAFRNKRIGFVFQFHHLLPEFSALENVCMPAFIAKTSKAEAEKRAKDLLDLLGLADRLTHK